MISRTLPLCLALLPGCMSVHYAAERSIEHGATRGDVHHAWGHSLFLGLIPVSSVDLDAYCPDTGVLHVKSSVGPLGFLATVFTLGVWTPTHVRVTCADWPVVHAAAPELPLPSPVTAAAPPPAPPPEPSPPSVGAAASAPLAIPAGAWAAPDGEDGTDTIVIETADGTRVIVER